MKTRIRLSLLLALTVAPLAFADARVEARRHFKLGMSLVTAGNYDDGIVELLQAYWIKPHPSVLFNIAKAHDAAGRPGDALNYYRKYLDTNPPDAPVVRAAMERLEAALPKIEPKPEQPEKKPEPTGPAAGALDQATLEKLNALTDRLEKALARVEALPDTATPNSPVNTAVTADAPATSDDFGVPYEETVVAASRRAQSTLEAPNATTIITGDEIRATGLQSIPEILRRVPGAEVMTMGTSSANVSFRGFNQRIANKVLVLIDGRPEYQDFLGISLWPVIPIGIEEIERIEVIRGPGSALYGANAMLGIINIITRTPGTGAKGEFTAWGGNGNTAAGSYVASGGDALKYRASVGYQQSDKYSRDYAEDRADVQSTSPEPNLGLRSARANLTTFYAFNKDISISVSGGVNRMFTEVYAIGILRNFFLDGTSGYTKVDVTGGPLKLRLFWNHLDATSGPQYEPIGQRTLVNHLEANVFDGELFFQKEFQLGGTHLFGAGISGRLKRLGWDYMSALQQELHAAAFVQDEWHPIKAVSIVASYRVDRHPLLDNGQPGYAQSPRVSVNFIPTEGQAVRASFSTAFRQPTFLESYMDLRTPVPGVNGASVLTQGNRALKPERLISFEVGYRGEFFTRGISIDAALYWNIVSDLVVLSAVNQLPADQAFDQHSQSYLLGRSNFVNDPATYTARGGELGLTWNAMPGLDVRASAAVQQIVPNENIAVCGPCTQAPVAKLNAGFVYKTPVNVDLSADVSFVSSTVWVEREPLPSDPTQITSLQNNLGAYGVVNARIGYRFLNDKVSISVVGTQLAGAHQEHPFGNNISRRVFGLIKVTP